MKRRYLAIFLLIFVFSAYLYTANFQRYLSPISSYWDPLDTDHEYFSIGKYPEGHTGACMMTIDDVSYATSANDVIYLSGAIDDYGVATTFFVIPRYGGEDGSISQNEELVAYLNERIAAGDEVALHGYYHYPSQELKGMSYNEQLRVLQKGKTDLANLFGSIYGFRPPSFWKNTNTYKALEESGFSYCSSASIFNVFPYHPRDVFHPVYGDVIDIIEIPCFPVDYFWDVGPDNVSRLYYEITSRFASCQKKGTAFVVFSHFDRLIEVDDITGRSEAIELLKRFLSFASENNTWMPTMSELAEWERDMDAMDISYSVQGNDLVISITSDRGVDGLTFYMDLSNGIEDVIIYYNGSVRSEKENCQFDEVIIL